MAAEKSVGNRIGPDTEHCQDVRVRVLIVDDHPSFRASARKLLVSDGYEVVGEAADGEDAIRIAQVLHPDVVLLDVQLPGIDGFEVAQQLAAMDSAPEVILTSSRDSSDYGSCVEDCGARGFVPKAELSGAALSLLLG